MGSRRKTDAPKSKAHQERTGPRFDWAVEVEPGRPGELQEPTKAAQPDPEQSYAAWEQRFREACLRCLEVGSYIDLTGGTGFRSTFLGTDLAGRNLRSYRFATSKVKTGRETIESLRPVDPTGAVLIGKPASGDVLWDIQRETGCSRAFLCGLIDGFDALRLARKAELIDHPDYTAGHDAGRQLRGEFVRRAPVDAGDGW